MRRVEAENRRLQKEKERQEQRLLSIAEREEKERNKQDDRARTYRLTRDNKLAKASQKLANRVETDFAEVFAEVKSLLNTINRNGGPREKITVDAIVNAINDDEVDTIDKLASTVIRLITPTESFGQN
jgi:DNA anti-recombination protein RmuC